MIFYLPFIKSRSLFGCQNPLGNLPLTVYTSKQHHFILLPITITVELPGNELMQRFLVYIAHLTCKIISSFFDNALENCSSYFYLYRLPE